MTESHSTWRVAVVLLQCCKAFAVETPSEKPSALLLVQALTQRVPLCGLFVAYYLFVYFIVIIIFSLADSSNEAETAVFCAVDWQRCGESLERKAREAF